MQYDVVLIHPPATYDFRKRTQFPGPIAHTLGESTDQFIIVPFGMVSIAEYLDRNGYKVIIDNLGHRMIVDKDFDVERHIRGISAKIFAIGLQWSVHSQGAMEIAKLCKTIHPNSLVILGGLTATRFHTEIVSKFRFIDAVIRGEAERPLLEFVKAFDNGKISKETPSLTYRNDSGRVIETPLMKPSADLDDFNFTRLDLLEPRASAFPSGFRHWKIPVCRGCTYNCAGCGGSAYSYRTYFGMEKLSLRSPEKIVEDMKSVLDQGVRFIGLSQDPRMGGRDYWQDLVTAISIENLDVERLAIDLHSPADEEFVKALSTIGKRIVLTISPESGAYNVRKQHGRGYSDEAYLNTAKYAHKYGIPISFFFMVGLAKETRETFKETQKMWEQLCILDQKARLEGRFRDLEEHFRIGGPTMSQMILLDPGSLAFDFPEKYGYKLIFRDFEQYVQGLSTPSWHMWINYETEMLSRSELAELFLESIDYETAEREKYGLSDRTMSSSDRFRTRAERMIITEVDRIMLLQKPDEKLTRLLSLKEALDLCYRGSKPSLEPDPYSYRRHMRDMVHPFVGLTDGGEPSNFSSQ